MNIVKDIATKCLIEKLEPSILIGCKSLYKIAESKYNELKNNKEVKVNDLFKRCLQQVKDWNTHTIQTETHRIEHSFDKVSLERVLKAIYKCMLKELLPGKYKQYKKFYTDVDKYNFIHCIYIKIAKCLYNNPDMLHNDREKFFYCVKDAIISVIYESLPLNDIMENYIEDTVIQPEKPVIKIQKESDKETEEKENSQKLIINLNE